MLHRYMIAGLCILGQDLPACFAPFEVTTPNGAIACIITREKNSLCEKKTVLSQDVYGTFVVQQMPQGWLYTSPSPFAEAQVYCSFDYETIRYYLPPCSRLEEQQQQLANLLRLALECRLIRSGVLSMHAACVLYQGEAVAFSAKSGTGKSTRAQSWIDELKAQWISGDRPAVCVENNQAKAFGVPWDGKEQIFTSRSGSLRAFCEVRRSTKTWVRTISAKQAQRFLMQGCFIPMWDTEIAAIAIKNIKRFAECGCVYRVFCGPDSSAAIQLETVLFKNTTQIRGVMTDMKIAQGFQLKKVVDEYMVLPTGKNIKTFQGTIILNEVSAFIFEQLEKGISKEDLLETILAEFEVERTTAYADLNKVLDIFSEYGLLDSED